MLQINQNTLANNLQSLQTLADELLDLGRSPKIDTNSSNDISTNGPLKKVEESYEKPDFSDLYQSKDEKHEEKVATEINHLYNSQEKNHAVNNEDDPSNEDDELPATYPSYNWAKDTLIFHQHQSPMVNLKNLLERKTDKLSTTQAEEIAKKLYFLEGKDKRDIVPHLLQK